MKDTMRSLVITGADTELGQETTRQLVASGYQVTGVALDQNGASAIQASGGTPVTASLTNAADLKQVLHDAQADTVLNLVPQQPNTLLSDGQDWKKFDRTLSNTTTALLQAAEQSDIRLLVQTSYALLYGNAADATETTPLIVPGNDAVFQTAIGVEEQVKHSTVPTCVLRLGYLYGPQSEDLKLYIKSFQLGRPYFAGPANHLGQWLHFADAAQALVKVVEQPPGNTVFNVADHTPVSFADFIDQFASTLGRKRPGHIPMWLTPLALLVVVTPQQVELLKLRTTVNSERFRQQLGWTPVYPDYRAGLRQTVQTWQEKGDIKL